MKLLRIPRSGRTRFGLATGAAAIAALTIVGGPAAAHAASTPAPKSGAHATTDEPAVVAVNCAPSQGGVQPGQAKPLPNKPVVDAKGSTVVAVDCDPELTEAGGPTVVEVPGAKPDFAHLQPGTATAIDVVPQPVGGEGKTTAKR